MRERKNSLVPIGEAFGGLDGPVKALRDASPQARHHFTRFDQVNQLVGAKRSGPRSWLSGAADGLVFAAAHEPRQPASVRSQKRSLQAGHDRRS